MSLLLLRLLALLTHTLAVLLDEALPAFRGLLPAPALALVARGSGCGPALDRRRGSRAGTVALVRGSTEGRGRNREEAAVDPCVVELRHRAVFIFGREAVMGEEERVGAVGGRPEQA